MKRAGMWVGVWALVAVAGCARRGPAPTAPQGPLQVITLVEPMRWLVERLGGDGVVVTRLAPAGEAGLHWRPAAADVQRLQAADLIVLNGAGVEQGLALVSLPDAQVVRTAAGFREQWIPRPVAAHRHGDGPAHSHGAWEGYTWLDPLLFKRQAEAVRDALVARRPALKAAVEARLAELATRLDGLHRALDAQAPALRRRPLLASDRIYGYVAQRYGLSVRAVPLDLEAPPDEATRAALVAAVAGTQARVMLVPRLPAPAVQAALRGLGLEPTVVAPGLAEGASPGAALEGWLKVPPAPE
ncbi:MAG: zinc ABC transporter substrate-binding protein [Myxococcales bacterium]|nr:zinc ABC transporter substrate-binding protein [Myxococcales bacterium]